MVCGLNGKEKKTYVEESPRLYRAFAFLLSFFFFPFPLSFFFSLHTSRLDIKFRIYFSMSIEILSSPACENIPQCQSVEHTDKQHNSKGEREYQQHPLKELQIDKEEEEGEEAVTKANGLDLPTKNRYYIQEESDNKPTATTTAVILKQKVIKKPPPLYIDIKKINNHNNLDGGQHDNMLQQNIPLKSPSTSIRLMDLGPLNTDEQHVLEEDMIARRLARRQHRKTYADDEDDDEYDQGGGESSNHVSIGTRVAEGHRNYQLMYDMLTGIRIAVGRVSAKMKRELNPEDFTAAHKLVFDV